MRSSRAGRRSRGWSTPAIAWRRRWRWARCSPSGPTSGSVLPTHHSVPAHLLGLVDRLVGDAEQLLEPDRLALRSRRHADARRDVEVAGMQLFDLGSYRLGLLAGRLEVAVRQDQQELLAAVARGEVLVADGPLEE